MESEYAHDDHDIPIGQRTESGPRRPPVLLLAVGILILTAAGFVLFLAPERQPVKEPVDISLPQQPKLASLALQPITPDAVPISGDDLLGKVTLVNLWGPWCPYCRVELPLLEDLRNHFQNSADFLLVSVSCGPDLSTENPAAIRAETLDYLQRSKLTLTVHADPQGATRQALVTAARLDQTGLTYPVNVLLARDGTISHLWMGYATGIEREMAAAVEQLLAPKSKSSSGP